ncbi:hypothetical protein JL722_7141 [Aureococcus anophagefferens]|nr:hypothetical protein JL722_7141 [Aureococcus anophagefferens]
MRALRNGGLRGSQSQKVLPGADGAAMTASRPRPATVPAQHAYVFVRSASPERQQELAQLAAAAGFAARAAILVDVFDEDGDGAIDQAEMSWPLLRMVQRPHAPYDERLKRVFVLVISETVAASPRLTLDAFGAGARMLFGHYSLCHVAEPGGDGQCPICQRVCRRGHGFESFAKHLCAKHQPENADAGGDGFISKRELHGAMASTAATSTKSKKNLKSQFMADAAAVDFRSPYVAYAWLVVRRPSDGKYLMVLESAATPGCGGKPCYWLPAGKVDPGETLVEAAPTEKKTVRAILYAEPAAGCDDPAVTCPKSCPDFHSVGACWVDLDDLAELHETEFRHPDPPVLFPAVESGALVPQSLDHAAWHDLERTVAELTSTDDDGARARLIPPVWDQIVRAYRALAVHAATTVAPAMGIQMH